MFDVGFWEISLILVLALLVLGPERLPVAARKVGYWLGKGRRYIEGVKYEVGKELDSAELKRLLHNQSIQIEELQNKFSQGTNEINNDVQNVFETDEVEGRSESQYEILEEDDDEMDDEYDDEIDQPVKEVVDKSQ